MTRPGDIWQLGRHRLICGDSLDPQIVATLMANETAQMVFTDPPYNVPIDGHVSGLGAVKHPDFAMASGEMSKAEFTGFLEQAFRNLADHAADGSIHFICMDWRHMAEILEAGGKVFSELKNLIVWAKDNGGMGTFYRSRHELIFAFKKGIGSHINSFELGQHGRYRTNVWAYKGMNSFGASRNEEIQLHPTVKPVAMIADAIKDVSCRNGIVLDPFGGSGSTLIAAHKTGRRVYLCELDPLYSDRIIRRWQVFAKDDAVLETTGQRFEVAENQRPTRSGIDRGNKPVWGMPGSAAVVVAGAACGPSHAAGAYGNEPGGIEHVCWLPDSHAVNRKRSLASEPASDTQGYDAAPPPKADERHSEVADPQKPWLRNEAP